MRDELLLYDLTDSPFCAKVRMCFQVKGIPYRRVTLTLRKRRELRALNPLGKVPVLVDGGRVIVDSSAIVRHVDAAHAERPLLPEDPAARAYCALLEDWADESLYLVVGGFKWLNPANRAIAIARTVTELGGGIAGPVLGRLIARNIARRYGAWGYGRDVLPHFEERMRESLSWLGTLLADRPFLLGRALTLADVACYGQLAWMRQYAEAKLLDAEPAVTAWMGRLDAMPAVADVYRMA
jgi:glutathione S-transferase